MCSLVCRHVKKRFPKPPSPQGLVYLFSLMIVFLMLPRLQSSAGVDCTILSLQITSIWTVSIFHALIYRESTKTIFSSVSRFPSPFVVLTGQTFQLRLGAFYRVLDLWVHISREIYHTYLHGERQTAEIYLCVIGSLTIAPPCVYSASHLSSKGQGLQISLSAHYWQEWVMLLPSALYLQKKNR